MLRRNTTVIIRRSSVNSFAIRSGRPAPRRRTGAIGTSDSVAQGKALYVNGNVLKPPAPKVWKTYSIKLDSSGGWRVFRGRSGDGPATDQDLKDVLSDVTDLRIKGEFGPGPNTGGLDNVEFGADSSGGTEGGGRQN